MRTPDLGPTSWTQDPPLGLLLGRLAGLIAQQLRERNRYEMEGREEAGGPRSNKEMEVGGLRSEKDMETPWCKPDGNRWKGGDKRWTGVREKERERERERE